MNNFSEQWKRCWVLWQITLAQWRFLRLSRKCVNTTKLHKIAVYATLATHQHAACEHLWEIYQRRWPTNPMKDEREKYGLGEP